MIKPKPNLLLQKQIFSEDKEQNTEDIIGKYFNIKRISNMQIYCPDYNFQKLYEGIKFRGSLALAHRLGVKFDYANALNWLPYFWEITISNQYQFLDLKSIIERMKDDETLFVRPASAFKEFSGNVYSKQKLEEERDFLVKNKNISDNIICMFAPPVLLDREWRCVFVNHKLISVCQYMEKGEISVKDSLSVPEIVVECAAKIGRDDYFLNKFNYVIDIGEYLKLDDPYKLENSDKLKLGLIEVNAFETASFYACDLDKIYEEYAK